MEMVTKSRWFGRMGIALVILVAFVDFILGTYHLTHHGLGSGIIELVSTSLLVIAVCLISQAQKI